MEALREEDDEETWVHNDGNNSEDGSDEGGMHRGAPNQFDSLCDGVLTTLAIVHAAIGEMLELKDDLLQHALPPNVLTKVALTTTRVFRSVSDMHMPINELIRLVRLYSTPWEEKSTALKKLHEDYEAKKTQLNIAIKRLQLIDVQSKRNARDRRVMNWERLFAKLTAAKGHGRRWKFLIEAFKKKANEGIESMQEYIHNMDASSDEEEPDEDMTMTQMQHVQLESPSEEPAESSHKNEDDEDDDGDEDDEDESEDDIMDAETQDSASKGKTQGTTQGTSPTVCSPGTESVVSEHEENKSPVEVMVLKPPMKDQDAWTHEPQYDYGLHVRVFKPEGLAVRETKCVLTFGDQLHRTGIFDPLPGTPNDLASPDKNRRSGRGRLIGSRGGRGGGASPASRQSSFSTNGAKAPDHYEIIFNMPNGLKLPRSGPWAKMDQLRIAVHYGPKDEMIAMATIDTDDLEALEIPEITYPAPIGDDLVDPDFREGAFNADDESEQAKFAREFKQFVDDLEPLSFPLYPLDASSGGGQAAEGSLPMLIFWSKQPHPFKLSRMTETLSLRSIIHDMLGIDIDVTTKEDLNKEMQDEALSAISVTPEPKEETVAKAMYDQMVTAHNEELQTLQKEYEQRLQDLAESLQQMQETHYEREIAFMQATQERALQTDNFRPRSRTPSPKAPSRRPTVVEPSLPHPPPPKPTEHIEDGPRPQRRNFKVGKPLPNWGEGLPKDFFERMAAFEEESWQNRQRLMQRIQREISEAIEKNLAGLHRLNNNDPHQDALQDVSLPAVFMPQKSNNMLIFNPRASRYFHPTGSKGTRLTQPPSMVQLPPLPKNKMPAVVNLFDLSQNFHRGGPEWLMQRYLQQAAQRGMTPDPTQAYLPTMDHKLHNTPIPTQRPLTPAKIAEC